MSVKVWQFLFRRGAGERGSRGDVDFSPFPPFSLSPFLLSFCLLTTLSVGHAEQRLTVNGRDVAGLSTSLVSGSSYAPALALAEAIGGHMSYDPALGLAVFDYAGHLLSLRVYATGAEARNDAQAVQLDGRGVAGTGAVSVEGSLYVPVKSVVAAFGGSTEYNAEQGQAVVVFPRAVLTSATVDSRQGYDRFVLEFTGLTPYQLYFNEAANTLQVRLERLEPVSAQGFSGQFISNALLQQNGGYTDLILRLNEGTRFESYTAPREGGFRFILDVLPASAQRQDPVAPPALVIDAGHGGSDSGLALPEGQEGDLTLGLAQRLAETLRAAGLASDVTRAGDITVSVSERSQAGIGSGLYLSVHAADTLTPGQINLFYLSEANDAATLEVAIRENAVAALNQQGTDVMRRRLLLNLVPDTARGERYANALARELQSLGGYTVNVLAGLPLKTLEGAAGRGVLIEFNASNLSDPQLAVYLASAIRTVVSQEGSQ